MNLEYLYYTKKKSVLSNSVIASDHRKRGNLYYQIKIAAVSSLRFARDKPRSDMLYSYLFLVYFSNIPTLHIPVLTS
jgi:hypothetical protein